MSCSPGCFESIIASCDDIIIRANFPASFPLYWILQKVGTTTPIQRLATTDAEGDLTIPKSELPDGFLTPGNNYKITLKNGNDYLQPVTFVFDGTNFSCVIAQLMSFDRAEDDDSDINVIQFTEAIVPDGGGGGGGSALIVVPFVNQTSVTVTHNLGLSVDVTVYNLAGELITPTITEDTIDHNFFTVTFGSSTSGRILYHS